MLRIILLLIFSINILVSSESFKEAQEEEKRKELSILKSEFNEYYEIQEKKIKNKLNNIQNIELKISKKEKNIEKLLKENKKILQKIKIELEDKTVGVYRGMKAKVVAVIFDQMISEHKIDEVYSILTRLKSRKIASIFKTINPKNVSRLTQMLLEGKKPKIKEYNKLDK
jgi:flagellar motility protein MotE (MotC chaperone)